MKALSNQKYRDLVDRYGADEVGLLTGDNVDQRRRAGRRDDHRGAAQHDLRPVRRSTTSALVVLDEVHFLQDAYRGPVWEEVIIHLPADVRLVCLSATVSNAERARRLDRDRPRPDRRRSSRRAARCARPPLPGRRPHQRPRCLLPTFVDGRPNPDAAQARRAGDALRPRRRSAARRRGAAAGAGCTPPGRRRDRRPARRRARCCRRSTSSSAATSATRRRATCLDAGSAADDAPRSASASARSSTPGSAGSTPTTSPCSATPRSSPSSRPASPPTTPAWCRRSRRSSRLLRRGSGEGGVRHRDARRRHQHAGPDGGDREAHQVHRRAPRVRSPPASTPSSPGEPAGGASTTRARRSCCGARSCASSRSPRWRRAARSICGRRSGRPTTWPPTSSARTPASEAHHLLNLSFAQYQADRDVVRIEARLERLRGSLDRALRRRRRARTATSGRTAAHVDAGPRPPARP